jgi:dihydrofolate reductase
LIVSAIVAMAEDGLIGREGKLPWHLPDDLKRFRAITWGKPIVMGRRTFESLGRALPGRTNIVLTRRAGYRAEGGRVATSPDEALTVAASTGANEAVIIGGAEVYRQFLPKCDKVYVATVNGQFDGDTYFPAGLLDSPDWDVVNEETRPADSRNPFGVLYQILVRRTGNSSTVSDSTQVSPSSTRSG